MYPMDWTHVNDLDIICGSAPLYFQAIPSPAYGTISNRRQVGQSLRSESVIACDPTTVLRGSDRVWSTHSQRTGASSKTLSSMTEIAFDFLCSFLNLSLAATNGRNRVLCHCVCLHMKNSLIPCVKERAGQTLAGRSRLTFTPYIGWQSKSFNR